MNLRKDHYRKTFSSSKKWKEPHRTIGFKSQNGEGSTLSNLGSADDFVRATFDSDGLRVGEPNAKKNPSGSGRSDALSGVFKAGRPANRAPDCVVSFFAFHLCCIFFFALEIQLKRKSSVLLATALSDQGLSVVSVASDATQPQTCEKKLL